MSTTLDPSYQAIITIQESIQAILKMGLPAATQANMIAPLLSSVNQWSSQIPAILDKSNSPVTANLVFAIRADLFIGPRYTQNVLSIPLVDLPPPFSEFVSFIHQLIEAQKVDKDRPVPKVCLIIPSFLFVLISSTYLADQAFRPGYQFKALC